MILGRKTDEQGKTLQNPLSLLESGCAANVTHWEKRRKVDLRPCSAVPCPSLCHRNLSWLWSCDRYFSLWWPAWVCESDLQLCWALTESHHCEILKYSKHWVLKCNYKRFCQKSFGYSRWQNTIKHNNWFRSSISTMVLRTKIANNMHIWLQLVTQEMSCLMEPGPASTLNPSFQHFSHLSQEYG